MKLLRHDCGMPAIIRAIDWREFLQQKSVELYARFQACLRAAIPMIYRLGDLTIDTGRQQVSRGTVPVALPKLSYDLLLALVRAAPNVVSLDELMRLVWAGPIVSPETVSQRVKLLRDALQDDPRAPRYIGGLRGRGYHIVSAVEEIRDHPETGPPTPIPSKSVAVRPLLDMSASSFPENSSAGLPKEAIDAESVPVLPVPPIGPARVAICVLPFTNMSGDAGQDYFSDGITEDIITELSRWRLLAVRSRSASFRYRGIAVDIKRVARELNVRYMVEGSVRRMGERIRINAQLTDMETGNHIWAEKFDHEWAELFKAQDQVVQTIVSTLVGRVQVSDVERARRKPPASLAAYECVLKGNALSWDDPESAAEAIRLFEKAIEIDPGYGLAHAYLASLHWRRWESDPSNSDAALDEAFAFATRAVELDKEQSTCVAILGQTYLRRRSFDLALQHARRAIAMNPNNQWNVADMGCVLIYVGHAEEALVLFKRAREIDPYFDPPWYSRDLGKAYMFLQRYEEALAVFGCMPTRPYSIAAHMAGCYARLADIDRTRVSARECLVKKPDFSIARFMTKQPFQNPADAASLAESLRMAGLPD
jgi:TolB-like protein/DNA-binding winged helix-turn-helix (wHTH) protein